MFKLHIKILVVLLVFFISLIFYQLAMASVLVPPVAAGFYGTVKVNGVYVPDGSSVTAWCGGVQYASDSTETYQGMSVYTLSIPGEDPEVAGKQGCDPSETITFIVGGNPADQTASWTSGTNTELNLTTTIVGSVQVTKVVNWNGVTVDPSKQFSICIQGPSHQSPNCQVAGANGGTLNWSNLLPGDYTVTESGPGVEWTTTVVPAVATIPGIGGQATSTVTNSRKLGSLKVSKTVQWNGIPPAAQTFSVCIQGPSYVTRNCKNISEAGGDVTWTNLIPGSYTVTENDPGVQWLVSTTGSPAIVPTDGGQVTAGITNTRKLGSLQVTKAVNWNGITVDNSQVFEICIQGPSYGTLNCKSTGYNGGNLNWSILIPGTYTVTETSPGNAWTVAITGSPVNVPVDGSQASASVTNTHKRGILQITKVVNWQNTPTDPSKTFLVCITGPSYGSPGCQASDYDGSTLTWNDLLPGNYTVSETNPGDIWQVQLPSNPVNVLANGSITTATVTNTRKAVRLEVGWNLISLPVTPIDPATAAALSKINGAYDLVFAYLGCTPSDPWKKFDPDAPAYSNTLLSVGVSNGYWIQANQVKMFTLDGTQPASTSIPLCTGWNMIGYPSWTIRTIDQALVGIAGKYTLVYTYVASDVADPWKKFNPNSPVGNDLTTMQPWAGYWILMTQPATLVINQ